MFQTLRISTPELNTLFSVALSPPHCPEALLEVLYLVIYLRCDNTLDHTEEMDQWWSSSLSCRRGLKRFCGHVALKSWLFAPLWRTAAAVSSDSQTFWNVHKNFSIHSRCTIHFSVVDPHAEYFPNNYRFAIKLLITLLPLELLSYELAVVWHRSGVFSVNSWVPCFTKQEATNFLEPSFKPAGDECCDTTDCKI